VAHPVLCRVRTSYTGMCYAAHTTGRRSYLTAYGEDERIADAEGRGVDMTGDVDGLTVRDASDDERAALRAVTLAAYEEYATVMPALAWARYQRRLLDTLDADAAVERIVAARGGTIVGGVLLYPPAANIYAGAVAGVDWPEVRLLAVAPAERGHGVGAALMDECIRRARARGAAYLGLHTMDVMRSAVRMYERMGFVRAPELDFSPAEGVLVRGYRRGLGDVPPAV
jgi:GNAT superfamily N-acetyltransferase